MSKGNPYFSESIITQKDGYVTVVTITKDFIVVPKTVGYDYIPREHFKKKLKIDILNKK